MAIAAGAVVFAIRRREAPILTLGRKIVRGRPDTATAHVILAMSPQLAAIPIGGERKVVIQPDGYAGCPYRGLSRRCLAVDAPLHVTIELDVARVLATKFGDGRGVGMLVFLRPLRKDPAVWFAPVQVLVQSAIGGKTGKTFALCFDPLAQGCAVDDAVADAV